MKASRPLMPSAYGVPNDRKGVLPWSHASKKMSEALHYWVCTVDSQGRPHATPVDGLWLDDALYFGGSPETRRHRNIKGNREICVHLESAADVIIVRGTAEERIPDRALAERLSEASKKKYGYSPGADEYMKAGLWVLRARTALGWKQFPKDVTRWTAES
jgi:nitroimidazol reductase NimA-like FMN-containing flavoprotein (pyridoxamine 5'-phosphate oxidase superfamily)